MQQQQHHQVSPQFSPHHHPMTPNPQQHPMTIQQQLHMSPYSSQQQSMHHPHSQQAQHSPTIVVQPPSQFSPSSVHHHQLTLTTTGHQSPPNDPSKRQTQMQKLQPLPPPPPPLPQLLVKHESMSFDEQQIKTEGHDEPLNESINITKPRVDPLQCKLTIELKKKLFFFRSFQLYHLIFSSKSMKS
jgi:hypothetical protein